MSSFKIVPLAEDGTVIKSAVCQAESEKTILQAVEKAKTDAAKAVRFNVLKDGQLSKFFEVAEDTGELMEQNVETRGRGDGRATEIVSELIKSQKPFRRSEAMNKLKEAYPGKPEEKLSNTLGALMSTVSRRLKMAPVREQDKEDRRVITFTYHPVTEKKTAKQPRKKEKVA